MPCGFSPQGIRYLECLIAVSKILSEESTVCSGEVKTCLKKECLRFVEGSGNTVTAVGIKWVKVWKRVFGDVFHFSRMSQWLSQQPESEMKVESLKLLDKDRETLEFYMDTLTCHCEYICSNEGERNQALISEYKSPTKHSLLRQMTA